eukprot:CAMPEP_0178993266 /NCGR_PEP_ID=MMETSP0795-20121207/6609_1 /TAXON_ID=88552 /ORGANISM="Amoebophrya sp., Strain Ameob2" /LENGTH=981 /DNA_ID=CAMNT_0020685309 /DNA_START=188 /DNA_END=3130 /DNA_ORIENTATION=+
MGFGLQYVLSDESHYREFVCKICLDLVDLPGSYTTKCAHVFCSSCVNEWIKSCGAVGNEEYDVMNPAPTTFPPVPCPACKEPLVINRDIVPFNSLRGERLAFRLLNSIRCRCPLGGGSGRCTWEGDYSEVQAHLTNTESHREEFGTPSPPSKVTSRNEAADDFEQRAATGGADAGPIAPGPSTPQTPLISSPPQSCATATTTSGGTSCTTTTTSASTSTGTCIGGNGNGSAASASFTATSSKPFSPESRSTSTGTTTTTTTAAPIAPSCAVNLQEAEGLKELGNARFKAAAYRDAIQLYSKALALLHTNANPLSGSNAAADELEARLLTNRGACWMACGVFKHAVQDCQLATKKDPLFAKGFIRLSSAMFLSGASVQEAIGVLSAAAEATSSSKAPATGAASARTAQQVSSFQSEIRAKSTEFSLLAAALIDGQQALVETSKYIARRFSVTVLAEQKFQTAHDLAAAQFGSSQVPPDLLLWLARSKLANAKSDQANVLTRRVLRSNRQNVDALTVQALVLFVDGEVEQAATIVKEALKLNPDSAEALFLLKKVVKPLSAALVGGRAAVAAREFGQALEKFEAGIELVKVLTTPPAPAAPVVAANSRQAATNTTSATNTNNCGDHSPVLRPVMPEEGQTSSSQDEDLVASRGTPSKESASAGRGEHEVSFGGELLREPPSSPPTAPTAASAPLNLDAIAKENAAISALPKSLVFTQLLTEAATASFRLKDFKRCLKLCEHAIYARGDYRDALVLRANTLVNLGRYEEAVRSLEGDVRSMFEQDTLVQHAHQKAVFELRRSQRPDYYDLLSRPYQRADRASTTTSTGSTSGGNIKINVTLTETDSTSTDNGGASPPAAVANANEPASTASSASDIEKEMKRVKLDNNSSSSTTTYYKLSSFSTQTDIKNFYKQRCLELHPDKHAGESEEEQRKAKERFQLVQEAFEILCDDAKRKLWDEGYDKAAIEERIRAMHDAAHRNSGW